MKKQSDEGCLALQEREDQAYMGLPDSLSDYKSMRTSAEDFVPFRCRFCTKQVKAMDALKKHIGQLKMAGNFRIACQPLQVCYYYVTTKLILQTSAKHILETDR